MRLTHHGRALGFHAIAARPGPVAKATPRPRSRRAVTPRPDHPWRTRLWPDRGELTVAATS
jgi:hypothetical protein